jgi:hypothetical protein
LETKPGQLTNYAVAVLKTDASGWFPLSNPAEQRFADGVAASVKFEASVFGGHLFKGLVHGLTRVFPYLVLRACMSVFSRPT